MSPHVEPRPRWIDVPRGEQQALIADLQRRARLKRWSAKALSNPLAAMVDSLVRREEASTPRQRADVAARFEAEALALDAAADALVDVASPAKKGF